MKILIPSEVMPHNNHSIRAANVVLFNLILEFLKVDFVTVVLLPVSTSGETIKIDSASKLGIKELEAYGLVVESPLIVSPKKKDDFSNKIQSIFLPNQSVLFPIVEFQHDAEKVVKQIRPDWVMTVWSEVLTNLFAKTSSKIYAYYGNPVPKNFLASSLLSEQRGRSFKQALIAKLSHKNLEKNHVKLMQHIDLMGNVAKNDADYYKSHGVGQAEYLQNIWTMRFEESYIFDLVSSYELQSVTKIAASVGKLSGTANTYGFLYIVNELLPELRLAFGHEKFELHIFGSGSVDPLLEELIQQPEILLRGFVDDIDEELFQCPIFLCCNNGTSYNVGHTRYLHAWSLGRCVVAHANVREAMPELEHDKSALLGENAEEIAMLIYNAAHDKNYLSRIGMQGFRAFEENFQAPKVVSTILKSLLKQS